MAVSYVKVLRKKVILIVVTVAVMYVTEIFVRSLQSVWTHKYYISVLLDLYTLLAYGSVWYPHH